MVGHAFTLTRHVETTYIHYYVDPQLLSNDYCYLIINYKYIIIMIAVAWQLKKRLHALGHFWFNLPASYSWFQHKYVQISPVSQESSQLSSNSACDAGNGAHPCHAAEEFACRVHHHQVVEARAGVQHDANHTTKLNYTAQCTEDNDITVLALSRNTMHACMHYYIMEHCMRSYKQKTREMPMFNSQPAFSGHHVVA